MSDRRPENPELFTLVLGVSMIEDHRDDAEEPWVLVDGEAYLASPADLIAAIRAGVESGTIKGEVVRVFRWWNGKVRMDPHLENLKSGEYVVIGPVSDGGSET